MVLVFSLRYQRFNHLVICFPLVLMQRLKIFIESFLWHRDRNCLWSTCLSSAKISTGRVLSGWLSVTYSSNNHWAPAQKPLCLQPTSPMILQTSYLPWNRNSSWQVLVLRALTVHMLACQNKKLKRKQLTTKLFASVFDWAQWLCDGVLSRLLCIDWESKVQVFWKGMGLLILWSLKCYKVSAK